MKVFKYIIVEVATHTKNEKKVGDVVLVTSVANLKPAEEAVEHGVVKHIPPGCDIPIGSTLYFHRSVTMHNVRESRTDRSNYHLEDDLYLVPYSEDRNLTFGYFNNDDFVITGNYSLLKAYDVKVKKSVIQLIKEKGYEGMREDIANMTYPTEFAKDLVGMDCYLQPRSCYMIEINNEKYWAAQDNCLMAYETP